MKNIRITLVLAAAVLAVGVWVFVQKGDRSAPVEERRAAVASVERTLTPTPDAVSGKVEAQPLARGTVELLFDRVAGAPDGARVAAILAEYAAALRAMPREQAVALLVTTLGSRRDLTTRLPFSVGEAGTLASAPTLRVWMLDQLGQLNPTIAADLATTILSRPESSDEWAVAMRDFARVRMTQESNAFLKSKLRELLTEPRWQTGQSVGWFEAFDVAVFLSATDLTPDFARLLVKTDAASRPAAHAAFLTLDRLLLAAPAEMLTLLQAEPALMQGRELTRADYFARADLRDEAQRTAVEKYLLDPVRTAQELAQFGGIYPNANRMISKNLLTPTETPKGEDLAAHDRESLAIVKGWLTDPRFASVHPVVEKMHARLAQFVKESSN